MPSGQTHDRITLWSLPVVTGLAIAFTRSGNLTLLISGGFLFSGLMLSPDLDLNSRPFQRWGWLRWIWIPYQKSMRHRSVFSHGPIIGTTLRILYLVCWIAWFGLLILLGVQLVQDLTFSWHIFVEVVVRWLVDYWTELIALFVGLELGAMSHSLSDWTNSAYKRFKKPKRKSRRTSKKR